MTSKSEQVRQLLAEGLTGTEIAKRVGCSTNLVYAVKSQAKAKAKSQSKSTGRQGGRPRKQAPAAASPSTNGDPFQDLVASVRGIQRERDELRDALEKIARVVEETLA